MKSIEGDGDRNDMYGDIRVVFPKPINRCGKGAGVSERGYVRACTYT